MNLQDLVRPIVEQPSHAAPPMTDIAARAHRRTIRRRGRTAGIVLGTLILTLAGAGALRGDDEDRSTEVVTDPGQAMYTIDVSSAKADDSRPPAEVLPGELVIIDDDTVALAWANACNTPSDAVEVLAGPAEVELRLRIGWYQVSDCVGASNSWVLMFDLHDPIGDRRVVARADGYEGDRTPSADGRSAGATRMPNVNTRLAGFEQPGQTGIGTVTTDSLRPTAVQVPLDFSEEEDVLRVAPPDPCPPGWEYAAWEIGDDLVVPQYLEQPRAQATTPCGSEANNTLSLPIGDLNARRVLGEPGSLPVSTPTSNSIQGGTTTPAAPVAIDLTGGLDYGGRSLQDGSRIVLPNEVVILDDDTVALAWSAPCNQPAETAVVDTTPDEVEIRLSLTTVPVNDCVGEPDHWVTTFEVPVPIGDRRVLAVADIDGQRRTRDARSDGRVMPVSSVTVLGKRGLLRPVAAQINSNGDGGVAEVAVIDCGRAVNFDLWIVGNVLVPDLRVVDAAGSGLRPCGPVTRLSVPNDMATTGRLIGAE